VRAVRLTGVGGDPGLPGVREMRRALARAAQARASPGLARAEPAATRRGNNIVAVYHVHGHQAGGTFRDVTVADGFTFSNGHIVRMQACSDPAQLSRKYSEGPGPEQPPLHRLRA
jgi:hypothetical protein